MRSFKLNIVLIAILSGTTSGLFCNGAPATEAIFSKRNINRSDTAEVNRHIRKAVAFAAKSKDLTILKAEIDTAEAICIDKKIEFPAALYLIRAEYFFFSNDFRNASQEASIAMKKAKSSGDNLILAKTLIFLGNYSMRTKFYMESISYLENAISIAEKYNLPGIIPSSYWSLADVYTYLGNIKEQRNSLNKLIEASRKENNTKLVIAGLRILGKSYVEPDRNFKTADSILTKCLEIAYTYNDTLFIAWPLTDLGWNFYREKDYDSAIKRYNLALTYSEPAKIYAISANALGNLGTIYRDLGDNKKSIQYYAKSIDQAKLGNVIFHLSWVYKDISDMYLGMKDTADAYKNYVLYKLYSDSLLKKSSSEGLLDARIRYDADSHNKEVELLSLKLDNQRLLIYGSLGLFVLCVAVFILLLSRAKINNKRRISEMNRKIAEVTQANLRQQMNPHFIFNTLNSIQYYMYQHDKLATNNYLTKFASLMRRVLENSQHTSVPLRDELDALNLYLDLEMIRFKDKFEYEITVDEEIDTLLYKVPTMLIQPYVENSICHGVIPGEHKGSVKVDLKLDSEYILCTIEDNGIGRDAAQEKKRAGDKNHNSLGTQIVSSRLDLVNALYGTSLKTTYTDLRNENGEPTGTRVEIQIPILS
jgi:tetratricopeptide (TPR) repeat protein